MLKWARIGVSLLVILAAVIWVDSAMSGTPDTVPAVTAYELQQEADLGSTEEPQLAAQESWKHNADEQAALASAGGEGASHLVPDLPPRRFTLVVTGDLMVHTEQMVDAWQPDGTYDFSSSFAHIAADLQDGDYTLGNLETVFAGEVVGYSDYPRFNTPDSFGEALKASGFDFLTTANNHCMDKDEPGLLRTLEVLDNLGIAHTGTFSSPRERDRIQIQEVGGARIAFLSYTFSTNGIPVPRDKEYLVNFLDEDLVASDLQRAKAQNPDLIVVLPHMGNEYELDTKEPFKVWMNYMVEQGADVVLASHPHVLQEMVINRVEDRDGEARDTLIAYSLGNFISSQQYEPRECGIVLKLDFFQQPGEKPVLERVRFVPTWVQFWDSRGGRTIRVLPIADAIENYEAGGNTWDIQAANINRLYRAHDWITNLYLHHSPDREKMQREYIFYENPQT